MRLKNLLLIMIIPVLGFTNFNIEKINELLSSIKKHEKSIYYFSNNRAFISKLSIPKSRDLNSADIIIFPKSKNITKSVIVNSFEKLKSNKNSIGAIYLKKGRTQILFVEERLKARGFSLSKKYKRYIIKECYLNEFCPFNNIN